MILYGWNNYLLKSVQLEELGINRSQSTDIRIEYRQKYFHLFFIPIFPLGKFWAIKQHGKFYDPTPELKVALQSVDVKTKNSLWAWTGIFVALGALMIYNVSEKLEARSYAKKAEAHSAILGAFFKDSKNTEGPAKKLRSINYIIDSTINDESYDKKPIDTADGAIIKTYIDIQLTQLDTLSGFTPKNTAVFTCVDHKKTKAELPGDEIRKALSNGTWSGYSDTSSVFRSIRTLNDFKYLLIVKEYNRMDPAISGNAFNSGYSLANAYVFDIDSKQIINQFKVLGSNSDSVSHFTFKRRGESSGISNTEWRSVLKNDLNKNVVQQAYKHLFGKDKILASL